MLVTYLLANYISQSDCHQIIRLTYLTFESLRFAIQMRKMPTTVESRRMATTRSAWRCVWVEVCVGGCLRGAVCAEVSARKCLHRGVCTEVPAQRCLRVEGRGRRGRRVRGGEREGDRGRERVRVRERKREEEGESERRGMAWHGVAWRGVVCHAAGAEGGLAPRGRHGPPPPSSCHVVPCRAVPWRVVYGVSRGGREGGAGPPREARPPSPRITSRRAMPRRAMACRVMCDRLAGDQLHAGSPLAGRGGGVRDERRHHPFSRGAAWLHVGVSCLVVAWRVVSSRVMSCHGVLQSSRRRNATTASPSSHQCASSQSVACLDMSCMGGRGTRASRGRHGPLSPPRHVVSCHVTPCHVVSCVARRGMSAMACHAMAGRSRDIRGTGPRAPS